MVPEPKSKHKTRRRRAATLSLKGNERPILDEIEGLIGGRVWTARGRRKSLTAIPTIVLESPNEEHVPQPLFVPEDVAGVIMPESKRDIVLWKQKTSSSDHPTLITTIVNAAPHDAMCTTVARRPSLFKAPTFSMVPLHVNTASNYEDQRDHSDASSDESDNSSSSSSSASDDEDEGASRSKKRYKLGSPMSQWLLRMQRNSQPVTPNVFASSTESTDYFDRPITVWPTRIPSNEVVVELPSRTFPLSHATSDHQLIPCIAAPSASTIFSYVQADDTTWTKGKLLEYADKTRFMLHHRVPTSEELTSTLSILTSLLEAEQGVGNKIELKAIAATRLDKLLEDILSTGTKIAHLPPLEQIFSTVHALVAKWKERFGDKYVWLREYDAVADGCIQI